MRSKELCDLLLCRLPLCGLKDESNQILIRCFDRQTVDIQKQQRGFQTNSLVAVNEWMVLNDMNK